jgi:hypothetical protein
MSRREVIGLLGTPVLVQRGHEIWIYADSEGREVRICFGLSSGIVEEPCDPTCTFVQMMSDQFATSSSSRPAASSTSTARPYPNFIVDGPFAAMHGLRQTEIRRQLGPPVRLETEFADLEAWHYGHSPSGSSYIRTVVDFDRKAGVVTTVSGGVYWD